LRIVSESNGSWKNLRIVATASARDVYGNSSEEDVIVVNFGRYAVEKINFDGFPEKNVYLIQKVILSILISGLNNRI